MSTDVTTFAISKEKGETNYFYFTYKTLKHLKQFM